MPYVLLIQEPRGQRLTRNASEGEAAYAQMLAYAKGLEQRGLLLGVQSLKSDDDAVRVSIRSGQRSLIDGPFAEAKEMVGGFFLLACETRDEAIALASECPAADWAAVEVRELGPCFL